MRVSITRLRQDLFRLAETKTPKLSRIVGRKVVAPRSGLERSLCKLLKEMEAEWRRDWAEL
ncbi:MAG: hypothetical protein ACRD96_02085 [Bryobacteraceae bacterium]